MSPEPKHHGPGAPREVQETSASELDALAAEAAQARPLRPGEQAALLAKFAGSSDAKALERLLETHLGLVLQLALAPSGRGLSVGDLFQEGSVGLLAAIRAFPDAAETDFERFIAGQVALSMEDALVAEEEELRRERLLLEAAADYDRVELELARELKRAPTVAEIGQKLEWTPERTEHVRSIVADARRKHDEEILQFVEAEELIELFGEGEIGPN